MSSSSEGGVGGGERVRHVAVLTGHQAPISKLVFSEAASLLASGCKAGSVRIWDISVCNVSYMITTFIPYT